MKINKELCIYCDKTIESKNSDKPNLHSACETIYFEALDIESSMLKNIENLLGFEIPIIYSGEESNEKYLNYVKKNTHTKFITEIQLFSVDLVKHLHNDPEYVPQIEFENDEFSLEEGQSEEEYTDEEMEDEITSINLENADGEMEHHHHHHPGTALEHIGIDYAKVIDYLGYFTRLEYISLNILGDIAPNTFKFKNLDCLRILNLQLTNLVLSEDDQLPETLTEIALVNINPHFLEDLFSRMTAKMKVENLSIISKDLEKVPESIATLTQLQELDMSDCDLKKIPEELGKLKKLKKLVLANNQLVSLPESLMNLQNLEYIDLTNNQMEDLEVVSQMPKLQVIKMLGNEIHVIPESFTALKLLTTCLIGGKISSIPDLQKLKSLQNLALEIDSKHSEVIEAIPTLTWLKHLTLESKDTIEKIPMSFEKLQNLQTLQLKMKRRDAPEFLVELPAIQKITLENTVTYQGANYLKREIFYAVESIVPFE